MQDHIIQFLKETDGYLSGEDISHKLKISRSAIWKNIEELRKDGYDIIAVPHLGYKLISCPDKLFPREIQHGLKTKLIGKKIIRFEEASSTMDEGMTLAMKGAEEGTVICAETQTKGRGRLGRGWVSPKSKGIYMSVILRPVLTPTDVAKLTLLGAVALCEALEKVSSLKFKIKWPNDILIGGKKVAGILTELNAEMDRVRFVVLGIGINVNTPVTYLPPHATSLRHELQRNVSRVELMQEILQRLEHWYAFLKKKDFETIMSRWRELSSTLGKRIKIDNVEGQAVDLDSSGGLVVRNDKGQLIIKMTGDVIQV